MSCTREHTKVSCLKVQDLSKDNNVVSSLFIVVLLLLDILSMQQAFLSVIILFIRGEH